MLRKLTTSISTLSSKGKWNSSLSLHFAKKIHENHENHALHKRSRLAGKPPGPKKKKKLSYRHWPLRQFKQGALQQIKSISSKNLIQNERKVNREETSQKLGLSWINFPESLLKSRHLGRQLVFLTRVFINISNCAELKSILAPVPMYTPRYPFNRWANERKMTMILLYLFYFFYQFRQ